MSPSREPIQNCNRQSSTGTFVTQTQCTHLYRWTLHHTFQSASLNKSFFFIKALIMGLTWQATSGLCHTSWVCMCRCEHLCPTAFWTFHPKLCVYYCIISKVIRLLKMYVSLIESQLSMHLSSPVSGHRTVPGRGYGILPSYSTHLWSGPSLWA